MKVVFFRRYRTVRFRWEWHNHGGVRYLQISWGSPTHHRWWALKTYIYLTGGR
jgi:hypothetical protein